MNKAILGLGLLAAAPSSALAGSCFLDITRPLLDPTPWSAKCEPASTVASGDSINLLEGKPDCRPNAVVPCFEDPGIEVHLNDPLPKEGGFEPPSCFPHGMPHEWAHMGFVNISRSCFRALSATDHKQIEAWSKQDFRAGDWCRMDEFGKQGLDKDSNLFTVNDHGPQTWAKRFSAEYPSSPKIKPGSPAEAIYEGFHKALKATDTCLENVNPKLASRVRQAMGVEYRAGTGSVFRPSIECAQQQAYECDGTASDCGAAKAVLEPMFRGGADHPGLDPSRQDDGYAKLHAMKCRPAHPPGTTLGSIDAANLVPNGVVQGSPKIQIYDPTALFGDGAQGASTLFHEFLHAAGAQADKDHDHGTQEDDIQIPAIDQVYACQALAFTPLFAHLSDAQLQSACLKCADTDHADYCNRGRSFIETGLKCRISR